MSSYAHKCQLQLLMTNTASTEQTTQHGSNTNKTQTTFSGFRCFKIKHQQNMNCIGITETSSVPLGPVNIWKYIQFLQFKALLPLVFSESLTFNTITFQF